MRLRLYPDANPARAGLTAISRRPHSKLAEWLGIVDRMSRPKPETIPLLPASYFGTKRATSLSAARAYDLLREAAARYRRIKPEVAARHWTRTTTEGAQVLEKLGWRKVRSFWLSIRRPKRVIREE